MMKPSGIALVSGASSGIGAAFARCLAVSRNDRVQTKPAFGLGRLNGLPPFDELWLAARRVERLEALAQELRTISPDLKTLPLGCDLSESSAIASLAERAKASGKVVNILINNAGFGVYGPFADAPLERQLGEIDLNCRSLTEMCGRFSPCLSAGSLVVNVASLAAFAPLGNFAVYAATKAYVFSFSLALAAEWSSRGIAVHALCPGPVESEFALVASDGARTRVSHGVKADSVAAACLRAAVGGRWYSVPRWNWRLQKLAGFLAGPRISALFAARFLSRPRAASSTAFKTFSDKDLRGMPLSGKDDT